MPINRILQTQPDIQIAIRQLDDELTALKSQLASVQDKINQIKAGVISNGSNGSSGSGIGVSFNGDLTGSNVSQTVVGLQNKPIDSTIPTTGQILEYNGTKWIPANLSAIPGSVTFAGDLSGTNTSQSVTGISGKPLDTAAEAIGQLIQYDGTKWAYRTSPIINNNNAIQFLEPTNTFNQFQIICGSGGNFNLQWRPDSVTAFNNILSSSTTGAVTFSGPSFAVAGTSTFANGLTVTAGTTTLSGTLLIKSPDATKTLTIQQPNGDPSFNSTTLVINTNSDLRTLSGKSHEAWSSDNSKKSYMNANASGDLNLGSTSGNGQFAGNFNITGSSIISGNLSVAGGLYVNTLTPYSGAFFNVAGDLRALNGHHFEAYSPDNTKIGYFYTDAAGNMQFLSTSGLQVLQSIQANTGITIAGGTFMLNGPSSKYFQILPNDGTYPDPRIYSSSGTIRAFCSLYIDTNLNVVGTTTLGGAITFNGAVTCNSSLTVGASGAIIGGSGIKYSAVATTAHVHGFGWNGSCQVYVDNSNVGNITLASERWMKEDIQPFESGLSIILKLKPASYKYRYQPWKDAGQTHYGLIADEVEPVAPEMIDYQKTQVEGKEKEIRFTDPRPMWYMMLNAIKELAGRVQKLENINNL